ncbi:O-methyltransferase [uncultured Paenibacillus sp.]|uniref:O-methyltransferase n=1 Tax=uncultured Paenibacillus sp. TaxID=227322 RepID=UPI0015AFCABA|nr:O-methyltransferase [uncultured Paenibacillus sp.]
MLKAEQISLVRQIDMVFKELEEELAGLSSGTVFLQIRNNTVGKFGIRHNPIAGRNGQLREETHGLNAEQIHSFRKMAIQSLQFKRYWTHGEISYEFALRQGAVVIDAVMESNYNMANLLIQRYPHKDNGTSTYGNLSS